MYDVDSKVSIAVCGSGRIEIQQQGIAIAVGCQVQQSTTDGKWYVIGHAVGATSPTALRWVEVTADMAAAISNDRKEFAARA